MVSRTKRRKMMRSTSIRTLKKLIKTRFGGTLYKGSHQEGGQACILECASVMEKIYWTEETCWTDSPRRLRCFDIRPLNDIGVSDALRTKWMPKQMMTACAERDQAIQESETQT